MHTTEDDMGDHDTESGLAARRLPQQVPPVHDELADPLPRPTVPATARWVERPRPRVLAALLLVASLAAAVTCLVLALRTQSTESVVGLVFSALLAVLCRGAMMSSGLMTVELKGSLLTVRHDGYVDRFDLAGHVQLVELVGDPDRSSWRLRLETADGRVVELTRRQVDAREMHGIVEFYQSLAERKRRERERRNRI